MVGHLANAVRFEDIKDKIVFRLARKNESMEKVVPYVEYLDMDVIFYWAIGDNVYSPIDNKFMKSLGNINSNDLMIAATENTPKILGFSFSNIFSAINEYMDNPIEDIVIDDAFCPLYVVSNNVKYNGAAVLLYAGLMEKIAKKLRTDLYIIPCSIHELIIVKKEPGMDVDMVKDLISHVNQTELKEEDVLSNSLYHFDRETGEITIV